MASNPRPTTRTTITYGPLGAAESTSALMPVFIAPRYALHAHAEGYEDAFLCKYEVARDDDNASLVYPWPGITEGGSLKNVDMGSAKLVAENTVVAVNTTAITGAKIDDTYKNKIIFTKPVCDGNGESRNSLLGKYDVRIGDYIYTDAADKLLTITDVQAADVDAKVVVTAIDGASAPTATGTFDGTEHTVYSVQIVSVDTDSNSLSVRVTGISGDTYMEVLDVVLGTPVTIGSNGIQLTYAADGTYKEGDTVKVIATPAGKGGFYWVFVDSDNITLGDAVFFATSNLTDGKITLSDTAWSVAANGDITLNNNITTVVGDDLSHRIYSADMYVEYRELLTSDDSVMTLVSSSADGAEAFAGICDPQNPMGMFYKAASDVPGAAFYMMSVSADTDEATIQALAVAAKYETAYAPITYRQTSAVQKAVRDTIHKYSDPKIAQFKTTWFTPRTQRTTTVYPATGSILGTITNNNATFEGSIDLIAAGVRAGDLLCVANAFDPQNNTYNSYELKIISVADPSTVVVEPVRNITSWTAMTIKRVRTNRDYAAALAAEAADLSDHRIKLVWSDTASIGDIVNVEGIYVAAQLAAMRSALPPHAPLSDVKLSSVVVADTLKFTDEEYGVLNDGGVWVVANNTDGETISFHQITTLSDGTLAEEESAVSNGDEMVRAFRIGLKKYKGNANIYEGLLPQMRADLNKVADSIMARQYKAIYGPQLLSFSIKDLYIPAYNNAKVICKSALETPKPLLEADYEFNIF